MKTVIAFLAFTASLMAQLPPQPYAQQPPTTVVAQKWFGASAPGVLPGGRNGTIGNLPGDSYFNTSSTPPVAYFCAAPQGTPAPACTSVSSGGWTLVGSGGGGGGAVFSGATAVNVAFSATPTFSLAAVASQSPVYFNFGALTASVSAVTFSNKTAGAQFFIRFVQDATGGRTVTYGASVSTATTCGAPDPGASNVSVQGFLVESDGATVDCTGFQAFPAWRGFGGTESTTEATPASGSDFLNFNATTHRIDLSFNGSTFNPAVTQNSTDTLTNKTFDTAGAGNVLKINGTAISAVSGTGAVCLVSGSLCDGGGGSYSYSLGLTSAVTMTGSAVNIYSFSSVPALPSGRCYRMGLEIYNNAGTWPGGTGLQLAVDGTAITYLIRSQGGSGEYEGLGEWNYCNQAGSQAAQYVGTVGSGYSSWYSTCSFLSDCATSANGWGITGPYIVTTPVDWTLPHTVSITGTIGSGTIYGIYFTMQLI